LQILSHLRYVDIITLKYGKDPKWELIKLIKPDLLVATVDNYTSEEISELEQSYCSEVVVLTRQAETSTSAKVRKMNLKNAKNISDEDIV